MKAKIIIVSAIIIAQFVLFGKDIYILLPKATDSIKQIILSRLKNEEKKEVNMPQTIVYSADIKAGFIGEDKAFPVDNPADNIFHIYLDEVPTLQDKVSLNYELKGVQDHTAVTRSINDQQAIGGYFIQKNDNWTDQQEFINTLSLRKGDNVIRFTVSENAGYAYAIRNLFMKVEKPTVDVKNSKRSIICNQSAQIYYDDKAYLKGFIIGKGAAEAQLFINQTPVPNLEGEYEFIIEKPKNTEGVWSAEIRAIYPDGQEIVKQVSFNKQEKADYTYSISQKGNYNHKLFRVGKAESIQLEGIKLDVAVGDLIKNTLISATALRYVDIPALNPDMVNVTKKYKGYRLLPHGHQFNKPVKLQIEYDAALIPPGYTADDIRTYYFDETAKLWMVLPKDSINSKKCVLTSKTTHFTDFINGIIKVPESPETPSLKSTSIKDIKAADVSTNIIPINLPTANNMGTANLQYPIKLPAGRDGMQPQLTVQYNSEGGNGWMGLGWDFNTPSIGIETRWGVPRYDPDLETETYIMGGEQLTPVAHRDVWQPRTRGDKTFHPRIEGAFNTIIRHGNSPKDYWWEVISKEGTKSYYGGTDSGVDNSAVLKDENENIAQWSLVEIRDANDNFMRYRYMTVKDVGVKNGTVMGKQLYLDKITYTGHGNTEGVYSVQFIRDRNLPNFQKRADININAHLGFKQVTTDLLKQVDVKLKNDLIRSYEFNYKQGAFFKTLLTAIIEKDRVGNIFYKHDFDYYDEVREGQTYKPFKDTENWRIPDDNIEGDMVNPLFSKKASLINSSTSSNFQAGLAVTIGTANGNYISTQYTIGGNFSFSKSNSNGISILTDINGDGLPDKVFIKNDIMYFRANLGKTHTFSDRRKKINGVNSFSHSSTSSKSLGVEVHPSPLFVGLTKTKSKTTTSIYFSDFNGDGLIDIAVDKSVYFNHIDSLGITQFIQNNSSNTPNPIFQGENVSNSIVKIDPNEHTELIDDNPLHDVVRLWEAPFDGHVKIIAPVKLLYDPSSSNYIHKDGVRLSIQKQRDRNRIWDTIILPNDSLRTIFPTGSGDIEVSKGQRIYFRVQSIGDGAFDQVEWHPEIVYLNKANVLDPNNKQLYHYKSAEDFILASPQSVTLPLDGKITISGFLEKIVTSDILKITIEKTLSGTSQTDTVFNRIFSADQTGRIPIDILNLPVKRGDQLQFKVFCETNIDWSALKWVPRLVYTSADDGSSVVDNANEPIFSFCPAVDFSMYNEIIDTTRIWLAPTTGKIDVEHGLTLINPLPFRLPTGEVTLSVKSTNRLYYKASLKIFNTSFASTTLFQSTDSVAVNEPLYVEYHTSDRKLLPLLNTKTAYVSVGGSGRLLQAGFYVAPDPEKIIFGPLYRGWGQFAYNGNKERADALIDERDLKRPEPPSDTEVNNQDPNSIDNSHKINTDNFIIMYACAQTGQWVGYDTLTYISQNTISSSRMGEDDISVDSTGGIGTGAMAVNKVSKSNTTSIAGGISFLVGSGSASQSDGSTETTTDMQDFNGDRYPDALGSEAIQITNPRGGLDTLLIRHNFGNNRGESGAKGFTLGGTFVPTSSSQGKNAKAEKATKSAAASIGLSGNFSTDKNENIHTWMDINGDGLPDKVFKNGFVALNLGYKFAPLEDWGHRAIQEGESTDKGGGIGINLWEGSIQAGISASLTDNHTNITLQDVNGDGLIDIVILGSPIKVRLNFGNGFSNELLWGDEAIEKGSSTGESVNAAFSFCIPLIPFFPVARLCFNPSGSLGRGISRQEVQWTDIDGNGFPDILESNEDGKLSVKHSTIGKTNLLKSIKRPFGSSFTMDYRLEGNTYNMPQSKWVLASTEIFDGLSGDGADIMRDSFEYEDGLYNRRERDFYGFKTVKTHQLNTENNNALYRTTVQTYSNSTYYEKGLLVSEVVQDGNGNKYNETQNVYALKNISDGSPLHMDFATTNFEGSAFPALIETKKLSYEGQLTAGLKTNVTYAYDPIGNITQYEDYGDSTNNDFIKAKIQYHVDSLIKSTPSSIEVSNKAGLVMRKRQTTMDNQGNITQIRQYLESGQPATYDMEYDDYGNLKKITRPENHQIKRFFYEYTYDDIVHTYVTQVKDAFGYTSSSAYEYSFGQLLETTDMNKQKIKYTIDDVGRIDTIMGPYELASGKPKPYTIIFEYNTDARIPFAKTKHYDPEYKADIETITFMDGLMRPVQIKKTASFFTTEGGVDNVGMIVSGRVKFDAFGRTFETYYPIEDDLANEQFNPRFNNTALPTKTTYDVLDRPTTTTLPDKSKTSMSYEFGKDNEDIIGFKTTLTDALNHQKESYTDIRNRKRATKDEGPIWTNFRYNALSELIEVIDDKNNKTKYEYDNLGRKTKVTHPDAGTTEFTYDLANNLIKRITADLRKKIPNGGAINYTYDYERLVKIEYPKNVQNKVVYKYGGIDAKFNRVGRIEYQQDASGGQEFFYGPLGEIIKDIRTIYVSSDNVLTYVSESQYDTWNRIKTMTYPDGEKVTYTYNRAGKLLSMVGKKSGETYNYVTQLGYDEFEQRTFLKLGNGSTTNYTYEKDRRRLGTMQVKADGNRFIMDNSYTYDPMNNILALENKANFVSGKLGGPASHTYRYDDLYRLKEASGKWDGFRGNATYSLSMAYDNLHNITDKKLTHIRNGQKVLETNYEQKYSYNPSQQPHAPKQVGNDVYQYDANGNMTDRKSVTPPTPSTRKVFWDEENRIQGIFDNGYVSQYTYDASGDRIVKSHGGIQGVFINGAPAGAINHKTNYTVYVSPYLVAKGNAFTKHYYIEGQRIASKIGTGLFVNNNWLDKTIQAGGIDHAKTLQSLKDSVLKYYRRLDMPPGPPTRPYIYSHPDSTGQAIPSVNVPNQTQTVNWPPIPIKPKAGDVPGKPIKDSFLTRENLVAGYGFRGDSAYVEKNRYFFHPDHLGSTSYITDAAGVVRQHVEYIPFGETFVDEHSSNDNQPYLFNSKELDTETGLYYYGARYYEPKMSMWLGVDPMMDEYPNWSPFAYTLQNPVIYNDPDGKVPIDIIWDAGNVLVDIGRGIYHEAKGNKEAANSAWADLGMDAIALAIPYIPAGASKLVKVADASKAVDKVADLKKAEERAAKLSQVDRKGKDFTKAGKEAVIDVNKAKNGGKTVCETCGKKTTPAEKDKTGVAPPKNRTEIDHIDKKRNGGSGTPDNGRVRCRGCNNNDDRPKKMTNG